MHADSVGWRWWKKPLPDTLGEKNNYVLTADEVEEYAKLLLASAHDMQAVAERAHRVHLAIKTGRVSQWENRTPHPITLAHVLQDQCRMAKQELALLQFLLAASGKRVQQKRESESEKP